jgi:quinol monooxygenase YgiN
MYGNVARLRPLPGHEEALLDLADRWDQERRPRVPGFVAEYLFRLEPSPGEWVVILLFESRAAYEENVQDPQEAPWYALLRAHLQADPTWVEGEILRVFGNSPELAE